MNTEQAPPKKRGCLFYGCLSCIILSLVVVLLGYLVLRYLSNRVLEFTDTKPVSIESVQVSPAQLDALKKRIAAFMEILQEQKMSNELRLSAEDLNALIATDPSVKELRNKLFVMIDDSRLRGKVSWPLDDVKLQGRFLNGEATLKPSIQNGAIQVTIDSFEARGRAIPPQFLSLLNHQLLARFKEQLSSKNSTTIQKFESIQIKEGAVVLKSKGKE